VTSTDAAKPDLRSYLEARTAAPVGFSSDGQHVYVSANLSGTAQLYRVPVSGGELEQLTDFAEPVGAVPVPHSDRILLQVDTGGNERHQILILDGPGQPPRSLIDEPAFIHWIGSVRDDGRAFSYQCNRRNGTDFDVFVHDLDTGEDRPVFSMGGWCSPAAFSPDGRWLSVVRMTERSGDNDVYLVNLTTDEVIHVNPHDEEAQSTGPSWMPDSSGFYFSTDIGREFPAVARYDLASREWEFVLEREWGVHARLDEKGTVALLLSNEDGFSRVTVADPLTLVARREIELPGPGVLAGIELSPDGSKLAVGFTSSRVPGDVWLYDTATGESTQLTHCPNPVDPATTTDPELIRYPSFDGLSVPAFVYRSARAADGPTPAVVIIHGGPEGQSLPSWSPITQYLTARGYTVLVPNVRGSTGYGRTYHHLDDVHNRLHSVRDLEGLYAWMATQPDIDENRAALYGGSYGGYMVLAGLTFQPDLWAAAIDIVGISSLVTFLENTSPWRRKFREREYGSLETDRDFLHEVSPMTHIDNLRAPLFIIHGENDPRVPVSEARQIAAVLAEKGVRHELVIYPDEGHGLAKLANRLDAYPRAVDFLDEILKLEG
jgi:dipeptidyl aminopeptidase/acylaminoacyl peptidase